MNQPPYPPYQGQPPQPAQGYGQQGYPQQGYGQPPRGPRRNVGLVVVGAILLVIGLGAGALFLYNFYQYSTVASRFTSLPRYSQGFAVRLVQAAAVNRMKVFGPVSALFGTLGLVLGGLGLRKK